MQPTNDFSIFLVVFNGLVTLVIGFGFFTIKSIYKKIAETDQKVEANREHWDREHANLIENSSNKYTLLIEKQNDVKVELIKQQNDVKSELIDQQHKVKADLINHYT